MWLPKNWREQCFRMNQDVLQVAPVIKGRRYDWSVNTWKYTHRKWDKDCTCFEIHTIKGKLGLKTFALTALAKTANLKARMERSNACSLTTSSYFFIQLNGSLGFFADGFVAAVVMDVFVDVDRAAFDGTSVLFSAANSTSTMLILSLLFIVSLIVGFKFFSLLIILFGLCSWLCFIVVVVLVFAFEYCEQRFFGRSSLMVVCV